MESVKDSLWYRHPTPDSMAIGHCRKGKDPQIQLQSDWTLRALCGPLSSLHISFSYYYSALEFLYCCTKYFGALGLTIANSVTMIIRILHHLLYLYRTTSIVELHLTDFVFLSLPSLMDRLSPFSSSSLATVLPPWL